MYYTDVWYFQRCCIVYIGLTANFLGSLLRGMTFLNPYGGASQRGHGFSKLYIIQAYKNILQNKFCNNNTIKKKKR